MPASVAFAGDFRVQPIESHLELRTRRVWLQLHLRAQGHELELKVVYLRLQVSSQGFSATGVDALDVVPLPSSQREVEVQRDG